MRLRHSFLLALLLLGALPATGSAAFTFGLNSGSAHAFELPYITPLGARHVRAEFPIATPVARMQPQLERYARAGVQPLLLASFTGRIPSPAEARNLGRWARAFGPGGTAGLNVTHIEFGNETNSPGQYGEDPDDPDWYRKPAFLARAAAYAVRARTAAAAVRAANPRVGLLGIGEQYGGYTTWVEEMFEAVPDLGSRLAGWTVHPYGPTRDWRQRIDTLISATRARGAPPLPLWVTEWGLTTDGGRCLSSNYGWNRCMSYDRAANALSTSVAAMRARYGSRLAALYLYSNRDLRRTGSGVDREDFFGAVRFDGSPKGAYTATVRRLLATR